VNEKEDLEEREALESARKAGAIAGYRLALNDLAHGRDMPADLTRHELEKRLAGRV
jgi:hypothetical protein